MVIINLMSDNNNNTRAKVMEMTITYYYILFLPSPPFPPGSLPVTIAGITTTDYLITYIAGQLIPHSLVAWGNSHWSLGRLTLFLRKKSMIRQSSSGPP